MSAESIDLEELKKFNKTMEEWWDLEGEFKFLHQINPLRVEYILAKLRDNFSDNESLNILDVGSGGGILTVALFKAGLNVTGLDANEYNVIAATQYANNHNLDIKYINNTVENIPQTQQYDLIVALEVIEHVANPDSFVRNLTKLVKPGGIIIMSTINRTVKSYFLTIMMAEYILGLIPKGTHNYKKFLKPSEIQNYLLNTHMQINEIKGLQLDILTFKWQLSNDIDVNYFITIK